MYEHVLQILKQERVILNEDIELLESDIEKTKKKLEGLQRAYEEIEKLQDIFDNSIEEFDDTVYELEEGKKYQVKDWDEMAEVYELDENSIVLGKNRVHFNTNMKYLCNTTIVAKEVISLFGEKNNCFHNNLGVITKEMLKKIPNETYRY